MNAIAAIREWARKEQAAYAGDNDRPLAGYLALLSAYATGTAVAAGLARASGKHAPQPSPWDVAQLAMATHKLSRLIAKDPVTSPLRAPFTTYDGLSAAGELSEEVRTSSTARHAVGELLTCPMCLAQWVATGLVLGMTFAPRLTRPALATFTAVAGADFLQHGYAALQQASE